MGVRVNGRPFDHTKRLIDQGKEVIDDCDAWSGNQPTAANAGRFRPVKPVVPRHRGGGPRGTALEVRTRQLALASSFMLIGFVAGCSDDDPVSLDPTASADGESPEPGSPIAGDIPDIVEEVQLSVVAVVSDRGEGRGVIYDEDGVIVTNHHVVEDASELEIFFADGSSARGNVVAADPLSDLAVVRVDRDGLPPAEMRYGLPRVGELAIAIGNPLGFENTVTAGIVSGLHRAIPGAARIAPALVDLVQTDAAISPGNSGGALADGEGRVIGVNVAYIPPTLGAVSLGFAIPAATVADVVDQLLDTGTVEHVFLGVQPAPVTEEVARQFDLDVDTGVLVVGVVPGSGAEQAGLQPGDIIVAVAGEPVESVEQFLGHLRQADPGDEIELTIVRDGEEREVRVVLGQRSSATG